MAISHPLRQFVSVSPLTLPRTKRQATQAISIRIAVPEGAPLGVVRGTLQLKKGRQWWGHTFEPRLPIEVTVQESAEEAIQRLEDTGVIPALDRNAELAGSDVDNNGIRDDIDAYIESQAYDGSLRVAVEQLAREFQRVVVSGSASPDAAFEMDRALARAEDCVWSRSPRGQESMDLVLTYQAYTVNTEQRLESFLQFDSYLDGTTATIAPPEQREQNCVE